MVSARKGEAFNVSSGLPVSMQRAAADLPWYEFACQYADYKWPTAAATTRRSNAEALTAVTILMLSDDPRGSSDAKEIRSALRRWAFNKTRRDDAPPEILYRIYAKFLDSGEEELQRRIEAVYGRPSGPADAAQTSHAFGTATN